MKRVLAMLLAFCLILGQWPVTVSATESNTAPEVTLPTVEEESDTGAATSGTCGENLTWTLSHYSVLTISGFGPMTDFSTTGAPWLRYRELIDTVIIENGVTTIGDSAFIYCANLTKVVIPDSVTRIGSYAFYACEHLTYVAVPDGVTQIDGLAFGDCTRLANVTIGSGLEDLGKSVFSYCGSLETVRFCGDAPMIDPYCFYATTTTVCYPESNSTWTSDVMQDYCGTLTWIGIGELIGLDILNAPSSGVVGEEPPFGNLVAQLVYTDDLRFPVSVNELTISQIDTNTVGPKTVTVSYGDCSAEFTYGVHEMGPGELLDPSVYPEYVHSSETELDDTQVLTWPGATGLVLEFSEESGTREDILYIYVYDGYDNLIAIYIGEDASGARLEVPGDTVKIRLYSDGSFTEYGYSFDSISTKGSIIHNYTKPVPDVLGICTEPI